MRFISTTALISIFALTAPVSAADRMLRKHPAPLNAQEQVLAGQMSEAVGVARACNQTDGSRANEAYWRPRIDAVVSPSKRQLFAKIVKGRSEVIAAQMQSPSLPLTCDDTLDGYADRYGSTLDQDISALPLQWDDLSGAYGTGTHDMDPLAGVDALLDGY